MFKILTIILVAAVTRSMTVVVEPQADYDTETSLFSLGSPSGPSEAKKVPEVLPRDNEFDCVGNWTYLCTQSKKMGKNGCPEMEKVDTFVFEECQLNNLFSQPLMDCCTCYEAGQERCANPLPFH